MHHLDFLLFVFGIIISILSLLLHPMGGIALAGTPIVFTETFSSNSLKDIGRTTADWSTDQEALLLAKWKKKYGALNSETTIGSNITSDTYNTHSVALGDLDKDGDLDVVCGNYYQYNRIYLNNGTANPFTGISGSYLSYDYQNTRSIVLGDVDGDGDLDAVAGNDNDHNRLYLNNGTSNPFSGVTGRSISSNANETKAIALGDMDGDGDLDLVEANIGQPYIYMNNGTVDPFNGITGSVLSVDEVAAYSIVLGDVDNDGDLDLILGMHNYTNRLYLNNGTPDPFEGVAGIDIAYDNDYYSSAVSLGDIDGDGDVDLVAGNQGTSGFNTNRLYLNQYPSDANPFNLVYGSNVTSDGMDTRSIALVDVDGDGDLDLLSGNYGQVNQLCLNNGDGTFADGISISAETYNTYAIAVGDVDGDGDMDMVTGNANQVNRLYLNNSTHSPFTGSQGKNITSDAYNTVTIGAGDLDNDGDIDVVAGNLGVNRLYLNNGSSDPFNGVTGLNITSDNHSTYSVAIGDVNKDGHLDLVVGNYTTTNRLYLNNGTSNPFNGVSGVDISTDAHSTLAITLGDVNGDGDLDVVAGNNNQTNRLYRWLGASYGSGTDISVDVHATYAVAYKDIDKDGDLDVIAGNYGQRNRLYYNNGYGTFSTGTDISTDSNSTRSLSIADVDGDGDLDMLTGNYSQYNRLYFNNGTTSPFNGVSGVNVSNDSHATLDVVFHDLDKDGDQDILVANNNMVNRAYLNTGNGTFETGVDITLDAHYTYAFVLADFNGDGAVDIAAGNYSSHQNRLYPSQGNAVPFSGLKGADICNDNSYTHALALGDLDNDGDIDIIEGNNYYNYSGRTNFIYLNNGTDDPFEGVAGVEIPLFNFITNAIALGDVDEDGDLDFVTGNGGADSNHLFLNDGSGNYAFSDGVPGDTHRTYDVALADMDSDGDLDLVVANGHNNQVNRLYKNNGSGTFAAGTDITADAYRTAAIAIGDVDNDGDLDVVTGNGNEDGYPQVNRLYLNSGSGTFAAGLNITSHSYATQSVALGDLDNDGDLDLVTGDSINIRIYVNNGFGGFTYHTELACDEGTYYNRVALGDMDNDGDLDVVVGNYKKRNMVYLNNGTPSPFNGVTGKFISSTYYGYTRTIAIGDLDGDGRQDVVEGSRYLTPNRMYRRCLYNTSQGLATSIQVDAETVNNISNVTLTPVQFLPSNTRIDYYMSNNGGWRYHKIKPGVEFIFPSIGNDLRWRAELHSLTPVDTPWIDRIDITSRNIVPSITDQNPSLLSINQGETLTVVIGTPPGNNGEVILSVYDPDNISSQLSPIVQSGDNYSVQGNAIVPDAFYCGTITVPVIVTDGIDYSSTHSISVQVNDITNPTVTGIDVNSSGLIIDVTFSEPMGSGVTTTANYTISGSGRGTLNSHPNSVINFYENTYRLAWSAGEMRSGGDITIMVTGVRDACSRLIGSSNIGTDLGGGIGYPPTTEITNEGGTYTSSVSVSLTCSDGGSGCAQIYYSTDGNEPHSAYVSPILIEEDTVLKFYAVDYAGNQEPVQTEIYSIEIPTTITFDLPGLDPEEPTIIFGEGFTMSGSITPPPNNPNQGISIELLPFSGPPVFLSTNADENGEYLINIECDAITHASPDPGWMIRTSWPGDASHLGDTSDIITLSVNQADSTLSLDVVMAEAVKINSRPPIGGNFSPDPYCETMDLSDTVITLYATEPDGVTEHRLTAYTNQYGQYLMDYDHAEGGGEFIFDILGDWIIQAEYSETSDFGPAVTEEIIIRVVPTAGYAIVVQGRVASGEGMPSHHKTASFVYEKLKDRQLLDDDIQYLSWLYHDGWDGDPSRDNIQHAITEWARDKMDESYHPEAGPDEEGKPGDLYIIMVDHGWTATGDDDEGIFYIHPDDPLTSTEFATWLDNLQSSLTGEAAGRNIVVILGFCRAGAFIDDLASGSYPNRVVIASAAKDESSHRGPQDVDAEGQPLRDGEYFVSEFFKSVSYGKSIKQSFEDATALTEAFTSTGSGETNAPYFDDAVQHPILNDNGDTIGSNELSSELDEDGAASEFLYIGASPPEGNDPGDVLVTRVAEAQFLEPEPAIGMVDLWAEVDSPAEVRLIWLEVKAPNYDPIDPGAGFQIEMTNFKKATTDVDGTKYQWNAVGDTPDPTDLFETPGTYQIFYFVKDDQTGHTSPLMQGKVYRKKTGNLPPEPFDLQYPADCADPGCVESHKTKLSFDWEDALNHESEHDAISYTVLLSKADAAFTDPIRIEGLAYSACVLGPEHGIEDLSTYYWKVLAIDEYGGIKESSSTWVFKTDDTNLGFGWLEGHVYSAYDNAAITGATVLINGVTIVTGTGGYYLGLLTPDTYPVEVSATGFTTRTTPEIPAVTVPEGDTETREFWLAPDVQVPDPAFGPLPGTFTTVIDVALTCPNPSAQIYYTTNGSEPDEGSTLYTGPIPLTQTTTIKAKAYLFGFTPSYAVTADYIIDSTDGDLSGEGDVDLIDVVMAMQVIAGIEPASDVLLSGDVNGDSRIGLEEVIYILQAIAGLR